MDFFKNLLDNKKYLQKLLEGLEKEKVTYYKKLKSFQYFFNKLTKNYKLQDEVFKYLEKTKLNKKFGNHCYFFVTSRGEIPPLLELKLRKNNKDCFIFPWIISFKNSYFLDYLPKEEEKFVVVVENIAKKLYSLPEELRDEWFVSIDEFTTGSSLLYRLKILQYIKILEKKLKKKIIPNFIFVNLASNGYYDWKNGNSVNHLYLSKIRKNNIQKINKILKILNDKYTKIKIDIVNIEDLIIWQDNEIFYSNLTTFYPFFFKLNNLYFNSFFGKKKEKYYLLIKKIREKHKEFLKEILKKSNFYCEYNGLYLISKEDHINNYSSFLNLLENKGLVYLYELKQILEQFNIKDLHIDSLALYKIKEGKSNRIRKKKLLYVIDKKNKKEYIKDNFNLFLLL